MPEHPFHHGTTTIRNGSVLIAAITSCTNTSNPSVMLAAGLLAKKAVEAGLAAAMPGNTTGDIGAAIQRRAEAERTSVVRDFVGHGVGTLFHDEPNIMHFGVPGTGVELKPGMIFTIEPMINLGRPHVKILSDGWTAVTRDRTLSAQCEHSIGITETGHEGFTASPRGLFNPLTARR